MSKRVTKRNIKEQVVEKLFESNHKFICKQCKKICDLEEESFLSSKMCRNCFCNLSLEQQKKLAKYYLDNFLEFKERLKAFERRFKELR